MTLYFYYATCILREAVAAGAGSQAGAGASEGGDARGGPTSLPGGRPHSAAPSRSREPGASAGGITHGGLEFLVLFYLVPSHGSRKPAFGKMYPKEQNKAKQNPTPQNQNRW